MQESIVYRIGIMGGTFDPIHNSHLIIAENAYEQYQLDTVLFMPTGISPHKAHSVEASNCERKKMIELAIEDNAHFELSLMEMEEDNVSYTANTLLKIKEQYEQVELYFILGADALFDLEKWRNPSEIFQNCTLLVAVRGQHDAIDVDEKIAYLEKNYEAKIFRINTPNISLSSKLIRERIKEGKTIRYFMPTNVEAFIWNSNLYVK